MRAVSQRVFSRSDVDGDVVGLENEDEEEGKEGLEMEKRLRRQKMAVVR